MAMNIDEITPTPMNTRNSSAVKTGGWRAFRPVCDYSKCIKCWTCWKYCPDVSIAVGENGPVYDYDHCKGCGICANECPVKCIEMVPENK